MRTNLHPLFWLSLIPPLTRWVSDHYRSSAAAFGLAWVTPCLAHGLFVTPAIMWMRMPSMDGAHGTGRARDGQESHVPPPSAERPDQRAR